MKGILEQTSDISPNLIFNNAGFNALGVSDCNRDCERALLSRMQLFAFEPLEKVLANYHCNATAVLPITHHFSKRMIENKQRGAIFFTSSPAGSFLQLFSSL